MTYQHVINASPLELPIGKVVCVGRNYAEHAKELNNPVPDEPLLFIKPATAIQSLHTPIRLQPARGGLHYEAELAVLIGQTLTGVTPAEASDAVLGVGLALDLTFRDLQSQLKAKGLPWEKAKAFDGSCCLSSFVSTESVNLSQLAFTLHINDQLKQDGNSNQMLHSVADLVAYISEWFTLQPGDVVLTGTPAGVGELFPGDQLRLTLADQFAATTEVVVLS